MLFNEEQKSCIQDISVQEQRRFYIKVIPVTVKELNVSAVDAKKLEELMRTPSRDVFDEVHRSVFYLMKSDSYLRFKRDSLYTRLSKRLKKRDFVNYKTVLGLYYWLVFANVTLGMKQRLQVTLDTGAKKDDLLTERDWMLILSGAEIVTYVRGDTILQRGQKPQHFYKIKSGRVKFEATDEGLNAMTLGEGEEKQYVFK
jgi:hypothetical protein